ncbi:MAG: hypothetical protein MK135_05220 [Polyangiaceae bacterium]|nr:hypothetical protein [Polyangiaceae bacterium]
MKEYSFRIELEGSQEELFQFLGDPRQRTRWQSSLAWVKLENAEELPSQGMRWTEKAHGLGEFAMRITKYQPSSRWAEEGTSSKGEVSIELGFSPGSQRNTTEVHVIIRLQLRGLLRGLAPVVPWALQPLMSADLKKASKLIKSGQV